MQRQRYAWLPLLFVLLLRADTISTALSVGSLPKHHHTDIRIRLGPIMLESRRIDVIRECPARPRIDIGRSKTFNPVPDVRCGFCNHDCNWNEMLGLCLFDKCVATFCNVCMTQDRHAHRHTPMQFVYYQQNTSSVVDYNSRWTCDCCGAQSYKGAFIGLSCDACRNMQLCLLCLAAAQQGLRKLPGNGLHGCRSMTWVFTRP